MLTQSAVVQTDSVARFFLKNDLFVWAAQAKSRSAHEKKKHLSGARKQKFVRQLALRSAHFGYFSDAAHC